MTCPLLSRCIVLFNHQIHFPHPHQIPPLHRRHRSKWRSWWDPFVLYDGCSFNEITITITTTHASKNNVKKVEHNENYGVSMMVGIKEG